MAPEGGNFGLNSPDPNPLRRKVKDEINIGSCAGCPDIEARLATIQHGVDVRAKFASQRLSDDVKGLVIDILEEDPRTYPEEELQADVATVRRGVAEFLDEANSQVSRQLARIEASCKNCPGATISPAIVRGLGGPPCAVQ